jgi:branched-chain amino acid transport system ATP-binding protein
MIRLRVDGLTKRFGGLLAVDGVSFDVPGDGITAVIGPNGAGKTTLFSMISGFSTPTSGHVVFDGEDITGTAPHLIAARGLVRTFQLVQLFANLTTLENVKIGRHVRTKAGLIAALLRPASARREEQETERKARELIDFVGLSAQANVRASALPYGQQRLLEIALALAARPKVLLLDEPAAGVPREESKELFTAIAGLSSDITVLFIEHDMELVFRFASRVIVLVGGRVLVEGTPAEIAADERVRAVYLGKGHGEPRR